MNEPASAQLFGAACFCIGIVLFVYLAWLWAIDRRTDRHESVERAMMEKDGKG